MKKKMVFVSKVRSSSFFFFFFFFIDYLSRFDVEGVLGAYLDVDLSIETHMKYDKLLILMKKVTKGPI
jgi:hypothetical protein